MQKIIYYLIIAVCFSCGTRKVETTKTTEASKSEISEKTQTAEKKESQTNTVIDMQSDEIEITPIDNTKPVIINGKEYRNARIRALKIKSNTTIAEAKKEAKNETKQTNKKDKTTKELKNKQSTKTDYSMVYIMGIALLLIAGLMYFRFK